MPTGMTHAAGVWSGADVAPRGLSYVNQTGVTQSHRMLRCDLHAIYSALHGLQSCQSR
jgi:hypothetical protein